MPRIVFARTAVSGAAFIAIGLAGAMGVPAAAGAATAHAAAGHHAAARVPGPPPVPVLPKPAPYPYPYPCLRVLPRVCPPRPGPCLPVPLPRYCPPRPGPYRCLPPYRLPAPRYCPPRPFPAPRRPLAASRRPLALTSVTRPAPAPFPPFPPFPPSSRPFPPGPPRFRVPTIAGRGGPGVTVVTGGGGYTPGGWVFEGDWTGRSWAGHAIVAAGRAGGIGPNSWRERPGFYALYGYDYATHAFSGPSRVAVR